MGGRLTVSSKEHHGSTFTFILPYKVSIACDNSDYSDELSDMEHNDAASDDTTEGFFQFQPRTLGSLFSSNGSSRNQKLLSLPHKVGYTSSHDITTSKGTCSIDDASSSVVDASELSESASSSGQCHSPETKNKCLVQHPYNAHAWSQNGSVDSSQHRVANREIVVATTSIEPHQTCQDQGKANTTTTQRVTSSNKSEVTTKSTSSKPKILLVEDNKINVMVTQSMMKQLGHNIDVVNNGVEAVHAVQRRAYDLVLMVIS